MYKRSFFYIEFWNLLQNVPNYNILTHTHIHKTNILQFPKTNLNINIVKKWTESNFAYQAGVLELQAQCLVRGPAADDPAAQEPIAALARQRETTER